MRLLLVLLMSLAPFGAWAHDADIVFAQVTREADGTVVERLTMTPQTLVMLAPIDQDEDHYLSEGELAAGERAIAAGVWDEVPMTSASGPCVRKETSARLRTTYVELNARLSCGEGALTQTFRILSVLPSQYKVVLGVYGQGELTGQAFAQGHRQTLTLLGAPDGEADAAPGIGGWIVLGVEHIFVGIDHVAFLLAVILVGGTWRRILLLVTSFTVAHSITLGASALGLVVLEGGAARWVEIAIAASIVWIALENLLLRTHRHRVYLTFAFGLVHGFGFASVLMDLGLGEAVVQGLLGFNLGVELGQACIVGAAFPLIRWISRRAAVHRWTLRLGSGAILAAGAFWMVDRVVG